MASCDKPVLEHVSLILDGMAEYGVGGTCEKTYHALLELAEAQRISNGFAKYEPTGFLAEMAEMLDEPDKEPN